MTDLGQGTETGALAATAEEEAGPDNQVTATTETWHWTPCTQPKQPVDLPTTGGNTDAPRSLRQSQQSFKHSRWW